MVKRNREHVRLWGEFWELVRIEPSSRFIVGVDLGQSRDPTAIAVLRHHVTPHFGQFTDDHKRKRREQRFDEFFDIEHIERVPLGLSYPEIIAHVGNVLARDPIRGDCDLIIDETGVGRPCGDLFDQAGLKPKRVCITSGNNVVSDRGRWNVPKEMLISGVAAKLHTKQLRFAAALREAPALREELANFQRSVTAAGRATYQARVGKHDDLVLAVAIALWWATDRGGRECTTIPGLGFY